MSEVQTRLGQLIEGIGERDAIHIAVAPVIASRMLLPGQPISFLTEGDIENVGITGKLIGIVDPFLTDAVMKGQRFWMFLYPNTITSLKHHWTHPAFSASAPVDPKAASEAWLRAFIAGADCPGYETVIAAAINGGDQSWNPEYLHFDGRDAHGEIPPEFWDHVEIVTGIKIAKRPTYFSCSC